MKTGLIIILLFVPLFVFAHPGRTDSSGCHTCRTNCSSWGLSSGEYHCHQAKALPQPIEPIHSKYGEDGTGYTYPAPEYKNSKTAVNEISYSKTSYENDDNNNSTIWYWILGIGGGVALISAFTKKDK